MSKNNSVSEDIAAFFQKKDRPERKPVDSTRTERTDPPYPADDTITTINTERYVDSSEAYTSLRNKYSITENDRKRRKRRYAYEFFDECVDVLPKISRHLSHRIDADVSASALVRKYVDEGIKKTLKELGLKLEDLS